MDFPCGERITIRTIPQEVRGATTRNWEVWIPVGGPLVEHVPLYEIYDLGSERRMDYSPEEARDIRMHANVLGAFGYTDWPTFTEALQYVRSVMGQYCREDANA